MTQQPPVCQGFLIIAASRSLSDKPHPVGLFWTSDQPDEITQKRQISVPTMGFEPTVPASELSQIYALARPLGSAKNCGNSFYKCVYSPVSSHKQHRKATYKKCIY